MYLIFIPTKPSDNENRKSIISPENVMLRGKLSRNKIEYFLQWFLKTVLEKGMAIHSNTLAWRIPWTEEPGGLQSMGSQRVGHDWATNTTQRLFNKYIRMKHNTSHYSWKFNTHFKGSLKWCHVAYVKDPAYLDSFNIVFIAEDLWYWDVFVSEVLEWTTVYLNTHYSYVGHLTIFPSQ